MIGYYASKPLQGALFLKLRVQNSGEDPFETQDQRRPKAVSEKQKKTRPSLLKAN
jgi:hypothetical protein